MLRVVLAALVVNKLITEEQAHAIQVRLHNKKVPETLDATIKEFRKVFEATK